MDTTDGLTYTSRNLERHPLGKAGTSAGWGTGSSRRTQPSMAFHFDVQRKENGWRGMMALARLVPFLRRKRVNPATLLVAQANAMRDGGDVVSAAVLYRQAITMGATNIGIRKQLANMLKDSRQFQEATYHYLRCLEFDPADGDTFLQLGHLHKLQGDHAKAAEYYTKASTYPSTSSHARAELEAMSRVRDAEPLGAFQPQMVPGTSSDDSLPVLIRLVRELEARVQALTERVANGSPSPAAEQISMQEVRNNWYSMLPMFLNTASTIAAIGASIDALGARVQALEERRGIDRGTPAPGGEARTAS